VILSDQWAEFKRRLKSVDKALMMRLQVEYDNFILRSIIIILELRQSGIWRNLSQVERNEHHESDANNSWYMDSMPTLSKLLQATGLKSQSASTNRAAEIRVDQRPHCNRSSLTYEFSVEWFREVSEPMLWHILWQLYHNAFVSSCDYHGDNHWLEKFREKSAVHLSVNKMRDSSPAECSYILNSISSMLLSRTKPESKLVSFIATELFNLSFRHPEMRDKITKKGTECLVRCAEHFPHLISLFVDYMNEESIDEDVVELIKKCSLSGWICCGDEATMIAKWLIEHPLESALHKVARLLISKMVLNSPDCYAYNQDQYSSQDSSTVKLPPGKSHRMFDLRLRRQFALILYEASVHHMPPTSELGPNSLGASVELTLNGLFCEQGSTLRRHLIETAVETSYQQFYVWIWRLLITFRLHILNQRETDWNDIQSRSGTSRSIKNTVLVNDSFHPVPSIQDIECLKLADGIESQNPMASFLYLVMTDATWQANTTESCLSQMNLMANFGHLTPSLMTMKYFIICHLTDLSDTIVKDQKCLEYFTTIITSDFDATRLASLIVSQLRHLKQYRQLQLSEFYIRVLLEVTDVILKQLSSAWFFSDEYKLEKVACLLDHLVRFNFATQRLEIIRKFYDCSYSMSNSASTSSWFGSLFNTEPFNASSTRREFLTTLHVLTQKFKKYQWLRWITTECDSLRLENIWEDIVAHLGFNEHDSLDLAIKKVCPRVNPSILKSTLPIYSWIDQIFDIVETDLNHPLCPLIWYNFFLNYFANSLNGDSVGPRLISQETMAKLSARLDSLVNYHLYKHRNWSSAGTMQQNSLAQLYRAYRLWSQDGSLQNAYVDIDRLPDSYLVPVLKSVMESSTEDACVQFIDIQSIETQNMNLSQIWSAATQLEANQSIRETMFVDSNIDDSAQVTNAEDEASDVVSVIVQQHNCNELTETSKALGSAEDELKSARHSLLGVESGTNEEIMGSINQHFKNVFDESSVFESSIYELDKIRSELGDLVRQLYTNKKREHIRLVPCADGHECTGQARIKFEIEEATIDGRKSECISDRQRQFEEVLGALLMMPTCKIVRSAVAIEHHVKKILSNTSGAELIIKTLLSHARDPISYKHLNGPYYASNHLLKTLLELLSQSDETDAYNSALIEICLHHPGSVQVLSPHLSPSTCSTSCFLDLYKRTSANFNILGPISTFVILSKFDLNIWLRNIEDKESHHNLIKATCSALGRMGKQPDPSFVQTFELYKRHIQIELAPPDRRQPEEMCLVFSQFLLLMDDQVLCPDLWLEFMHILGLEKQVSHRNVQSISQSSPNKSDPSQTSRVSPPIKDTASVKTFTSIDDDTFNLQVNSTDLIEDISRLADRQKVFDYHNLNSVMKLMINFVQTKHETIDVTLLEYFSDFLEQFALVMISFTFMWLKSVSELYPDNHELNWSLFTSLWYHWVYLSRNCQSVSKTSYSLVVVAYVAGLNYMIQKIPEKRQDILRSVLKILSDYIMDTKEVVYLELTILQRALKNLPWSEFLILKYDLEYIAKLSEQDEYNISDLISHILLQVNIKESLTNINEIDDAEIPHLTERLATTIVLQSTHLKGFRLHDPGYFFSRIPVDSARKIVALVLTRMEYANLEHSQNNKLLVNLLRFMCIKPEFVGDPSESNKYLSDSFERSIIYARFVSSYLQDLIKNHPSVVKYHRSYLCAVIENSLNDLKILLSPDMDLEKKTTIYERLLKCCSSILIDEESSLLIARSLVESTLLQNRPIVVLEIFHAVGRVLTDARVLVFIVERLISLYLSMSGHYDKLWKSFSLRLLPSDLYLRACVEGRAPLAMLVYFESISRQEPVDQQLVESSSSGEPMSVRGQILASSLYWFAQVSVMGNESAPDDDSILEAVKLSVSWMRLLEMLELNLNHLMHCDRTSSISSSSPAANVPISMESKPADSMSQTSSSAKTHETSSLNQNPLVIFVRQLISIYDSHSVGSLWSYLKSVRSDQAPKLSLVALGVACFLADRAMSCFGTPSNSQTKTEKSPVPVRLPPLKEEVTKLRKQCLSKLEAARKSKHHLDSAHFIEALIESANCNHRVQYSEAVQLMSTYVRSVYSSDDPFISAYLSKIMPTYSD